MYIWLYIWTRTSRNASYSLALPGLAFLARPWVKSLLLLTDLCKSVSLSHTHSFSSFMAKLLFFCSPSGYSCSRAYFYGGFIQFAVIYGDHVWDFRGVDPLEHFSEVCECVNPPFSARLIVRQKPHYIKINK